MARVLFMGTPEEAIPTLGVVDDAHEIGLVITQPDRPKGRSKTPVPPPVKEASIARGLAIAQPQNRQQLATAVEEHGPFDVGVLVAYGRILAEEILNAPSHGLLNVHFSLLPRWRGAAPVARALIAGDPMTGVTIIKLDQGLDTGPVLTAQAIDIEPDDDAGTLTQRLANVGARLLIDTLPRYLAGQVVPIPQSEEGATYADKIESGDRVIDVTGTVLSALARVRGLAPAPGATLTIDGVPHKVLAARSAADQVTSGSWASIDSSPVIGFDDGSIELVTIQPPGRNPMSGSEWLRGLRRDGGIVT